MDTDRDIQRIIDELQMDGDDSVEELDRYEEDQQKVDEFFEYFGQQNPKQKKAAEKCRKFLADPEHGYAQWAQTMRTDLTALRRSLGRSKADHYSDVQLASAARLKESLEEMKKQADVDLKMLFGTVPLPIQTSINDNLQSPEDLLDAILQSQKKRPKRTIDGLDLAGASEFGGNTLVAYSDEGDSRLRLAVKKLANGFCMAVGIQDSDVDGETFYSRCVEYLQEPGGTHLNAKLLRQQLGEIIKEI